MPSVTKGALYKLLLSIEPDRAAEILLIKPEYLLSICDSYGVPVPNKLHYIDVADGRETSYTRHRVKNGSEKLPIELDDARLWAAGNLSKLPRKRNVVMRRTRPKKAEANKLLWASLNKAYERWLKCRDLERFLAEIESKYPVDQLVKGRPISEWIAAARTEVADHNPLYGRADAIFSD